MSRRIAATFAVLALLVVAVAWRLRGPEPKPASAPADEFSAERALAAERATIGGTRPHPIGSDENHLVRDRLIAHLRTLGYDVRVEQSFACSAHPLCANVQNIIATIPGQPAGPPVVLATHYDSVPAGPGASDDGSGVAALLEVARIIRSERFRNPVVLLIDDGEEAGLLGAEAFVAQHHDTAAVVNVEARGTSGPSYLFETGADNRWFLPKIMRAQPMPITTSLFATVYDLLPNDTDLTIFKRAGVTGVNFGIIGNVAAYHTPNDDIAHVDLRSLQHQGDNALAALRVLANSDLQHHATGNIVWFDILGFFVAWCPAGWTVIIAVAGLVLAVIRSRDWRGALWLVLAIVVAAVAGFLCGLGEPMRVAHPLPLILAAALAGITAACLRGTLGGAAIAWNAIGVVLAIAAPGLSYLFIVPGIVLAIADVIASAVAGVLWLPIMFVIYEALGKPGLVVVALGAALIASTIPMRRNVWRAALGVAVALVIVAALLPKYSDTKPERKNTELVNPDGVPRVQITRAGSLIHVRSQRNSPRMWLEVRAVVKVRSVNGVVPPPRPARFHNRVPNGWTRVVVDGPSMDVDVGTAAPLQMTASDVTFVHEPHAPRTIQSQDGDVIITTTSASLR